MIDINFLLVFGISISILLGIIIVMTFISFFIEKRNIQKLEREKKKYKKNKKRKNKLKKQLVVSKNRQRRRRGRLLIGFLCLGLVSGGTTYAKYYDSTNLSIQDAEDIAYAHYLIEEMATQLDLPEESIDAQQNMRTIGTKLSSYSAKKGSQNATVEGQILLNRYYNHVGQFGRNIMFYSQNQADLSQLQELTEEIQKLEKDQRELASYYKIELSSLSNQQIDRDADE